MRESDELERQYTVAERKIEPQRKKSIARGPIGLIAVLVGLSLAVGTVAAVDLRRLNTPRGTALAWTSAAVFGDCPTYQRLSVSEVNDNRSEERLCQDLRRGTERAREESREIQIEVLSVEQRDREATVEVEVRRPDGDERVALPLRRKGQGWGVVLTNDVCRAVGCA